jgi:hypothetical protein
MSKYEANSSLPYEETRSKQKKIGNKNNNEERVGVFENKKHPAKQSELTSGDSYKTIWKASFGR